MFLGVLTVFLLNVAASTMGVLNTLLISKKVMKPVYIIMFVDAIVFTTGLKMVSNGDSFLFVIAYACGKVMGAYFANKIEDKIALGISEIVIFEKGEKALYLADILREKGYSVTTTKGYGLNGNPRFSVSVTLQRKEMKTLKETLDTYGYDEATMIVRDVKGVSGKIKERLEESKAF